MKAFLFLVVLFFYSCSSNNYKQSLLDSIIRSGTIKIGTTGDYPPFSYRKSKSDEFEGIDIELAKNLAQSLGVKVEFVQTSWGGLLKDLEAKRFHLALSGISKKLSRQKAGFFSSGYIDNGKMAIARCEEKDKFSSLSKINHSRTKLVVNPGGTNERFAKESLKRASLRVVDDNRAIFQEIINNRADVMVTDSVEVAYQSKLHRGVLCSASGVFTSGEIAVLLQRDIVLKEYVDTWLHLLTKTKAKKRIFRKYIDY